MYITWLHLEPILPLFGVFPTGYTNSRREARTSGTPGAGDTAIVPTGTVNMPLDTQFTSNTIEVASAALNFVGDQSISFNALGPTVDQATTITSQTTGVTTAETTTLNSAGNFINAGTILADGPPGSAFTLNISGTPLAGPSSLATSSIRT